MREVVEDYVINVERNLLDPILPLSDFVLKAKDGEMNRMLRKIMSECEDQTSILSQIVKLNIDSNK